MPPAVTPEAKRRTNALIGVEILLVGVLVALIVHHGSSSRAATSTPGAAVTTTTTESPKQLASLVARQIGPVRTVINEADCRSPDVNLACIGAAPVERQTADAVRRLDGVRKMLDTTTGVPPALTGLWKSMLVHVETTQSASRAFNTCLVANTDGSMDCSAQGHAWHMAIDKLDHLFDGWKRYGI